MTFRPATVGCLPESFRHHPDFWRVRSARLRPSFFQDSTHQIWYLTGEQQEQSVLKVCDYSQVAQNRFWMRMQQWFAADLRESYPWQAQLFDFFAEHSTFAIPCLLASFAPSELSSQDFAWLWVEAIEGQDLCADAILPRHCHILGQHLQRMHALSFKPDAFGEPIQALAKALAGQVAPNMTFTQKMADFLEKDTSGRSFASTYPQDFQEIKQALLQWQPQQWVPMLMDFRWDQCREDSAGQLYLLDLEAAIVAPIEFDWLLMEVLLTPSQWQQVVSAYAQPLPSLRASRTLARAVFYHLELLGPKSWDWWRALAHYAP
ncbi:MAG: hypothetical protein JXR44_00425 [Thiotrichales bacterium]|nr:hypothetical protein [Thiotrichales bacterium]